MCFLEIGETAPHYLLIVDRKDNLDSLEVWVEMTQGLFSDEVKRIRRLKRKLETKLKVLLESMQK